MKSLPSIVITALIRPFGWLPLGWSQAIGAQLGKLAMRINTKRQHIARRNIETCFPEKTAAEVEAMIEASAAEAGKWLLESAYVWFRNPKYLENKVEVRNPELLEAAFAEQKGVVVVLPHLGNWEMLNYYVPQHYPMGAMYKPIKSPWLESLVLNSRSRVGTEMFSVDSRGVRKAFKHLKQGKLLVILSDHLPTRKVGVFAPFFGQPAHTGKLTHILAKHNDSKIVVAAVLRKPKGAGFEMVLQPVDSLGDQDEIEAATRLNTAIEDAVRLAPEQYQWAYPRFRRQPDGKGFY